MRGYAPSHNQAAVASARQFAPARSLAARGTPPYPEHAVQPAHTSQAGFELSRIGIHAAPGIRIQPKLMVGEVDDPAEQHAYHVADQVMRITAPQTLPYAASNSPASGAVQPAPIQAKSGVDAGHRGIEAPPIVQDVLRSPGHPLDKTTRAFFEPRFGHNFSEVRVHGDSRAAKSADAIGARAFASGDHIVFAAAESERNRSLIAHELAHVVQQKGAGAAQSIRRAVRTDGGAQKVNEAEYQGSGTKSGAGSRFRVATLIADSVPRVFSSVTELEDYANGQTDYIGDIATKGAGTFWYRLPKDQLTVLGEFHENPKGSAEDIIVGLRTKRFMYEALNEMEAVPGLFMPFTGAPMPFTGTQARLDKVNKGYASSAQADPAKFNPNLENIVIKALTGAAITRNEYLPGNPPTMDSLAKQKWGKRASKTDYSYGERVALYLSFGIHLAADVAQHDFGPKNYVESLYVLSARNLKEFYLAHKAELDQFMGTKDGDDLIGIYELTAPGNFKNLGLIKDFTIVLHEYGARYVENLGAKMGNKALEAQGDILSNKLGATIDDLNPAREEIMWSKIQFAKSNGYLVVGMGDAHHQNLAARLDAAGIPHEEAEASLVRQKAAVKAKWT